MKIKTNVKAGVAVSGPIGVKKCPSEFCQGEGPPELPSH